ncbi:hypothetical protein ACFWY6_23210 [Streptomyces sp. NPDC059037]|uniref:hypothetical protein n=1 Tax=Streptomyces sp. NPDC059037 TaxID=3346710 RepID=UPI00367A5D9C
MSTQQLTAEPAAVDKPDEVVQRALCSSCSSYYRQMLPALLGTLGFKGNNTAYQPVMGATRLLAKYGNVDGKTWSTTRRT